MNLINNSCVQAKDGKCELLISPNYQACIKGKCPFFKTKVDLAISNRDAEIRCNRRGITFISRDDLILYEDSRSRNYGKTEKRYDLGNKKTHQSRRIKQYDEQGNVICIWDSANDVVVNLGFSAVSIRLGCRNGKKTHGYYWSYVR